MRHQLHAFLAAAFCGLGVLWVVQSEPWAQSKADATGPTSLPVRPSLTGLRLEALPTMNTGEPQPAAPSPVVLTSDQRDREKAIPSAVALFFRHGDLSFLQSMNPEEWTSCGRTCMQSLLSQVNAWQPQDSTALVAMAAWARKQSNGPAQVLAYATIARAEALGQPLESVFGAPLHGGESALDGESRSVLLELRGLPDWAWHQLQQRVADSQVWRVTLAERLQSATDPEQASALLNFLPESEQWSLLRDLSLRKQSLTASSLDELLASNGTAAALPELLIAAQVRAPDWLLKLGQTWAGRQLSGTRLEQLDAALADPNLSAAQLRLVAILLRHAEDSETAREVAQRRGVTL